MLLAAALALVGDNAHGALQGLYVSPLKVTEAEQAQVRLSTSAAQADVWITNQRTGQEVWRATVDASEQATNAEAWNGTGWSRSEALPSLPAGYYRVCTDSAIVAPASDTPGMRYFCDTLSVVPVQPVADVLVVYDSTTEGAYCQWGGRSLYSNPYTATYTLDRPCQWFSYEERLQNFLNLLDAAGASWELADVAWLESQPGRMAGHRALAIVGKFEYVTRTFREQLQAYYDGGGRLLCQAVDQSLFQARRENGQVVVFARPDRGTDWILLDGDPSNDHLATYEYARLGEPETAFFGTAVYLGGWPEQDARWQAWRVGHWLWQGLGITSEGQEWADQLQGLFTDGTRIAPGAGGLPEPDWTLPIGTPADFLVLGTVPVSASWPWWCWAPDGNPGLCAEPGWGVIGVRGNANGGALITIPNNLWLRDTFVGGPEQQFIANAVAALADASPFDVYGGYALPVIQGTCSDGSDDDGDGLVDHPDDPGCASPLDPTESDESGQFPCDDVEDDDGDGLIDHPDDPGCASRSDASEKDDTGQYPCDDGDDGDGDGLIDYPDDPGCASPFDPSERDETGQLVCDDGGDDDGDGFADFPDDPGCASPSDPDGSERSSTLPCDDGVDAGDGDGRGDYDPLTRWDEPDFTAGQGDPGCLSPGHHTEAPWCQDGADNDGDGLIDFDGGESIHGACTGLPGGCPASVSDPDGNGIADRDPQCGRPWSKEVPPRCGLGLELTPLLACLGWARSRRARRPRNDRAESGR